MNFTFSDTVYSDYEYDGFNKARILITDKNLSGFCTQMGDCVLEKIEIILLAQLIFYTNSKDAGGYLTALLKEQLPTLNNPIESKDAIRAITGMLKQFTGLTDKTTVENVLHEELSLWVF